MQGGGARGRGFALPHLQTPTRHSARELRSGPRRQCPCSPGSHKAALCPGPGSPGLQHVGVRWALRVSTGGLSWGAVERDGLPLGSSGPLTRGGGGGLTCRRWTWGYISAIQAAWQSKTSKTHTSRTLKVGAGGTSLCLRRWSRSSVCVGSEHLGMWWEAGEGGVTERSPR